MVSKAFWRSKRRKPEYRLFFMLLNTLEVMSIIACFVETDF